MFIIKILLIYFYQYGPCQENYCLPIGWRMVMTETSSLIANGHNVQYTLHNGTQTFHWNRLFHSFLPSKESTPENSGSWRKKVLFQLKLILIRISHKNQLSVICQKGFYINRHQLPSLCREQKKKGDGISKKEKGYETERRRQEMADRERRIWKRTQPLLVHYVSV